MRNNILSFFCAALVAIVVFSAYHFVSKQNTSRQAQASPNMSKEIERAPEVTRRGRSKKELLKVVSVHPEKLLELRGREVLGLLKAPGLVRQDFPTIVWQYRNDSCVLDIYFKAEKRNDPAAASVVHYEVRDRKGDNQLEVSDCVQNIARDQNGVRMVDIKKIYKAM